MTGRGDLVHRRRTTLPLLDKVKMGGRLVYCDDQINQSGIRTVSHKYLAVSENGVLVVDILRGYA